MCRWGLMMQLEACELVGTYMLNMLSKKYSKNYFEIYRDDGLAALKNKSGPQSEKVKKNIQKILKEHGLDIIIQCNMKVVNSLDLTRNLNVGTYISLTQNQTTKLNTYTKTQTINQASSGKFHYPQNQGYPPYLLTKKYLKKQHPLTKKHCKILITDT